MYNPRGFNRFYFWFGKDIVLFNVKAIRAAHFTETSPQVVINFTLGTHRIENCKEYKYLGLKINTTGNFSPAANELTEQAQVKFYTTNSIPNPNSNLAQNDMNQ